VANALAICHSRAYTCTAGTLGVTRGHFTQISG
jgi:hypothetical protein